MSVLASPSGTRGGHRRLKLLVAAITPLVGSLSASRVLAGGTFDGDMVSPTQTRLWDVGGANPGLNWDLDTLPVAADSIIFDHCGDGTVDMNALARTHFALDFKDWVTYNLTNGTFGFSGLAGTLMVGNSVSSTYGSDYFADGTTISAGLDLGPAAASRTIFFGGANSGTLRLLGAVSGFAPLTIMQAFPATANRGVYFDLPNGGYSGAVTITSGASARLLCSPFGPDGRTGTGAVTLSGGEFHILSDLAFIPPPPPPFTIDQFVTNAIISISGTIRADHNYTLMPMAAYAPGIQHILGSPGAPAGPLVPGPAITVDNPAAGGAASITFTADNGYNFGTYSVRLGHAGAGAVGTRTITVSNGSRREGIAGSVLRTSTNRQEEQVVTVQVGFGAGSSLYDLDPATGGGIGLIKTGTGVLSIAGDNTLPIFGAPASQGIKTVTGGVLRFSTALSYGLTGGVASPVTLTGVPAVPATPVSAAMGVAYDPGAVPGNLFTTAGGGIPGQAGAYDIDFGGYASAFFPAIVPPNAPAMTALRLGSSGAGTTTGFIGVYGPTGTYYLGGGGGTLTIGAGPALATVGATVQMGTTGTLLPGRVVMGRPVATGAAGPVVIDAGTLQVPGGMPGVFGATASTSVTAYSTGLSANGVYGGAPGGGGGSFDGPGQLLLSAADDAAALYAYGPGGTFGAAGLSLNRGAIGYDGGLVLGPLMAALPGIYNVTAAPILSSLYGTIVAPAPPAVATSILHLGGDYSAGVMTMPAVPITDNFILGVPVALIKSGNSSVLDLTPNPGNPYTGGTGILGGEIMVNMPGQLGGGFGGAVVIADGGILHVVAGGPAIVAYPNILRVANGPERRASTITVDGGVTASFSSATPQAGVVGSVLRKTGGGILEVLPGALGPVGDLANTWGIRASAGLIVTNQLPGTTTVLNGAIVFDGGTFGLASPPAFPATAIPAFGYVMAPATFAIPAATRYAAGYGYSSLQTYAGTASSMIIGDGAFFRTTGAATSSLMGALDVAMGSSSVFKFGQDAAGDDARGTGAINFSGGNVQFNAGGTDILFPHDGAFTLSLNFGALFSGTPLANISGNLLFNSMGGSAMVTIDGATVSNAVVPIAAPAIWTINGTGLTSWAGLVVKGTTFAIPPAAGTFASGAVNINRCMGAPVSIAAGASLTISAGTLNAGGTGDPFTDTTTPTTHLPVTNNATFNITAGYKHILSLGGVGVTTVSAGAFLDVGSLGPVTQSTFTVNGMADVGNVNVSGTTSVSGVGSSLAANYVRGNTLDIGASGQVLIRPSGGSAGGVSRVNTLTIDTTSGNFDISDNKMIVDYSGIFPGDNSPAATIRIYLINGRGGSGLGPETWAGSGGITSSSAATADPTGLAVGYRKAQPPDFDIDPVASFGGQTVDDTAILIRYTYSGDANLDGVVDRSDLLILQNSFNQTSGIDWLHGDFDYNGTCDRDDYNLLSNNYGNVPIPSFGMLTASFGSDFAASLAGGRGAAVPEPTMGVPAIVYTCLLVKRRRRPRLRPGLADA